MSQANMGQANTGQAGNFMSATGDSALGETITLTQAKKLIQCMAAEQSFLLLSPPGVGKSEMVVQAAAEAGLPCRSLLGTDPPPLKWSDSKYGF